MAPKVLNSLTSQPLINYLSDDLQVEEPQAKEFEPIAEPVEFEFVDKETGLVTYGPPECHQVDEGAEHKRRKREHGALIACPPVLDPAIAANVNKQLPPSQDSDLAAQRELIKKRKEEEEAKKALEAEKKQVNLETKQAAQELAVAKPKPSMKRLLPKQRPWQTNL